MKKSRTVATREPSVLARPPPAPKADTEPPQPCRRLAECRAHAGAWGASTPHLWRGGKGAGREVTAEDVASSSLLINANKYVNDAARNAPLALQPNPVTQGLDLHKLWWSEACK